MVSNSCENVLSSTMFTQSLYIIYFGFFSISLETQSGGLSVAKWFSMLIKNEGIDKISTLKSSLGSAKAQESLILAYSIPLGKL